jgi:hypothetical protein
MNTLPIEIIHKIKSNLTCYQLPYNSPDYQERFDMYCKAHEEIIYKGLVGCTCDFRNAYVVSRSIKKQKQKHSPMLFHSQQSLFIALNLYPELFGKWYMCCDGKGASYKKHKRSNLTFCDHGQVLKKKKKRQKNRD